MTDLNRNVIFIIILVVMSAFFSATETAFSSVNKTRLKTLANNGNKKAEKTLELAESYDRLLSTILIGNNIVNIMSASLMTVICVAFFPVYGASISTIVMTCIVLIFGEVIPKSIAKEIPETFAMAATSFISVLMFVFAPINAFFTLLKKLLVKIFKFENDDSMTPEELLTIVEEAEQEGDLEEHESDLIRSAIEFNDLDVRDVLTPRVDVVAIDIKMSLNEIDLVFKESGYSRLPVYENTIDNIVGVIHEKDFFHLFYTKKGTLKSIVTSVVYTNPHFKISTLLRQLQSSKMHMAVVIDEYGGTAGIITLEDILEELVGEIWDEHDEIVEHFHKINENTYSISCDTDLDDMFEFLNIDTKEEYDIISVGGWVIHQLDKMPVVGDTFDFMNYRFTVSKTGVRKVNEIKAEKLDLAEEE